VSGEDESSRCISSSIWVVNCKSRARSIVSLAHAFGEGTTGRWSVSHLPHPRRVKLRLDTTLRLTSHHLASRTQHDVRGREPPGSPLAYAV
jgi:hypothetical protein